MRRTNLARPVETISEDGNITEYPSLTDVGIITKTPKQTIARWIKNYPKIYQGYRWRYKDQDIPGTIWIDHSTLPVKCSEDGRIKFPNGRITVGSIGLGRSYADIYYTVRVKGKYYRGHRLIAQTFIPNAENKPTVDHIDRNTLNNHVSNLRWATQSEQNTNQGKRGRFVRRTKKK